MNLDDTRIFVKVVQLGSFSKAAGVLKLPKSTVSRTVSRLEAESGTKLLMRTTRSLTLTAAGRAFFEASAGPLQVLEDARKTLHDRDSVLSGVVRITAPEDLGSSAVSACLGALSKDHPGLNFELHYTDDVVDLVKEGFDIAIRLGKLAPSSFKTTRLGEVTLVLVASPAYLKKNPKIKSPADLRGHATLSYAFQAANPRWTMRSNGRAETVSVSPRIVSNQMTSLLAMAVENAGIAYVPHYLCRGHLERGDLVRVLPDWAGVDFPVSLVMPAATGTSARLKLVAERLKADVKQILSPR